MLKELNQTFAAICQATATTALAVNDGAAVLRIKGVAAKQVCALDAVKSIKDAKKDLSAEELNAAIELLSSIE